MIQIILINIILHIYTAPLKQLDTPVESGIWITNLSSSQSTDPNCNLFKWNRVEYADYYNVKITGNGTSSLNISDTTTSTSYRILIYDICNINIEVQAVAEGYISSKWLRTTSLDYRPLKKYQDIATLYNKGLCKGLNLTESIAITDFSTHSIFDLNAISDAIVYNNSTKDYTVSNYFNNYEEFSTSVVNSWEIKANVSFPVKAAKVKLGGGYSTENKDSTSSNKTQLYYYYHNYHQILRASIDQASTSRLAGYVSQDFKSSLKDVNSLTRAKNFFQNYGTHIIVDASFGGSLELLYTASNIVEGSSHEVTQAVKTNVGVNVSRIGVDASGTWSKTSVKNSNNTDITEDLIGSFIGGVNVEPLSMGTVFSNTKNWTSSIGSFTTTVYDPNFVLIDVQDSSLVYVLDIVSAMGSEFNVAYNCLNAYISTL